ncbi:hypothetical protein [Corynebacterium gottingense]|uniref:Uncharacterized protein n=1 Tax=Corynebacterium gottingense TaxID=2041036 RepID=A0ABX9UGJ2_9CORY|nr:hypothetical protein [Corynebacterium gottingense]RMD15387.1 hypothetical protein EAW56_12015 [Corynebacterium gottingense]WJZ16494.1 hypothetical protein CGOTTB_11380 [Corynebacterium gottingense]
MTTPNNGNTPGDGTPGGDTPNGDSPYGYEPYPDNPAGSHPENTGSSAWNPDSAGSASTTGSGQSDFGQNSADAYGANGYGSNEYGSNSYGASGSEPYGQGGFGPNGYEQFDVNAAAGAAGATALRYHGQELTDGTYGDGATPHPINDPANNGWTHTKGNGKLNITDAFSWAFKTTFSNWKVWIVLGLIACAWQWLTMIVPTGVLGIVPLFVYPVFFSAALQQTLARSFGWGDIKTPAYGKTLGVLAVFLQLSPSASLCSSSSAWLPASAAWTSTHCQRTRQARRTSRRCFPCSARSSVPWACSGSSDCSYPRSS